MILNKKLIFETLATTKDSAAQDQGKWAERPAKRKGTATKELLERQDPATRSLSSTLHCSTSPQVQPCRSQGVRPFVHAISTPARRSFPDISTYQPSTEKSIHRPFSSAERKSFDLSYGVSVQKIPLYGSGSLSSNRSNTRTQSPVFAADQKPTESSLEQIVESLRNGSAPRSIVIGIKISSMRSHAFFSALTHSKTTQAISFGSNTMDSVTCQLLARTMEQTMTLSVLRLGSNALTDESIASIVEAINRNAVACIKELYIAHNNAGYLAAKEISKGLQGSCGLKFLTVLNISHSCIEDTGGAVIADALCQNCRLKKLDVGANNLSELSGASFTRCLRTNTTLQELRIERNPFLESRCMQDLVDSILSNEDCALSVLYSTAFPPCVYRLANTHVGYSKHRGSSDCREAMKICAELRDWICNSSVTQKSWSRAKALQAKQNASLTRWFVQNWIDFVKLKSITMGLRKRFSEKVKGRCYEVWFCRVKSQRVTQAEREKRLAVRIHRCQKLTSLVTIAVWRLTGKSRRTDRPQKGRYPWWRLRLTDLSREGCLSRWGPDKFTQFYARWERVHCRRYFCCLKRRQILKTTLCMYFLDWHRQATNHPALAAQATKRFNWYHIIRLKSSIRMWYRIARVHTLELNVVKKWNIMFLRPKVRRWQGLHAINRRLQCIHTKIASRWQETDIRSNMRVWAIATNQSRQETRLVRMSKSRLLRKALTSWQVVATAQSQFKKGQKSPYLRCASYWRLWKQSMTRSNILKSKVKQACAFWTGKVLFAIMSEWSKQAKYQRLLGKNEKKMSRRFIRSTSSHYISSWRDNCAYLRSLHGTFSKMSQKRRGRTMHELFNTWGENSAHQRNLRHNLSLLLFAYSRRVLLEYYRTWKDNILFVKELKKKLQGAFSNRGVRIASVFFLKWRAHTKQHKGTKSRVNQRRRVHNLRLQIAIFKHWKESQQIHRASQLSTVKTAIVPWKCMSDFATKLQTRSALDQWNEGIFHRHSLIESNKQNWLQRTRDCFLLRCSAQLSAVLLIRAFSGWKVCSSISISVTKGREAFKGILSKHQLTRFIMSRPFVNVEKLIQSIQLDRVGVQTQFLQDILKDWDSRQREGSLPHKLELYRFLCYIFGEWNPLLVEECTIDANKVISGWATPTVSRSEETDSHQITLELPYVSTRDILESKLHRAMNMALATTFGSLLPTGCSALEDARRLCLELGIAASYLDVTGDHEPWVDGSRVKMVGIPERRYAAPVGWVRVGVRVDQALANDNEIWEKWNVTFHGTRKEMLLRIVSSRTPLVPGCTDATGRLVRHNTTLFGGFSEGAKYIVVTENAKSEIVEVKSGVARAKERSATVRKGETFDPSKYVFTTPSIKYASQPFQAIPFQWNGKRAQIALQLRQSARHVRMMQPPYIIHPQFDDCYSNHELGWFSNAQATMAITGILFRYLEEDD